MLILNAAPETLTVVSPTSPLSDIAKASQLWEEAIDLLITAGRLLQGAKEQSKRNFTKLLSSFQLEKAQVNKLIKAASVASEIPTVVAQRLGLHQILQLGQPSNQAALEVIAPDDTQISIAQKIKSHRPTKEPVNTEAVKFVGKKGNTPKLRIEIPDCQETESIYSEWKASGLTALQWLQTRNMQFSQPQAIGSTSYSVAVTEASTTVAIPTPLVISSASEEPSSKAVSEEFLNNNSLATLVSRATEATPASEASEAQKPFSLLLSSTTDELHTRSEQPESNVSSVMLGKLNADLIDLEFKDSTKQHQSQESLHNCFCPNQPEIDQLVDLPTQPWEKPVQN